MPSERYGWHQREYGATQNIRATVTHCKMKGQPNNLQNCCYTFVCNNIQVQVPLEGKHNKQAITDNHKSKFAIDFN